MVPLSPVPLHIITGFLGSGKTTLLNRLLHVAVEQGKRIGVIVNEWGRVNIDSSLIAHDGIELEELNNGQLFCSCLSADFVQALVLFAQHPLDVVFVETSGMANPLPLKELLAEMEKRTGHHYDYQGMTALVDPESFLDLAEVVNAVEEQIIGSQRVIINKVDLASPETVRRVREKVQTLNPSAEIIETSYAQVERFWERARRQPSTGMFVLRHTKEAYGRPVHHIIRTKEGIAPESMAAFVRKILLGAFRIKGIVRDRDGGWFYVDGVNNNVTWRSVQAMGDESKIVIIAKMGKALEPRIRSAWKACCGVSFTVE